VAGIVPASAAGRPGEAVKAAPDEWVQVFRDDFNGANGSGIDESKWRHIIGTSYPGGPPGFGTGEIETNTSAASNVALDGEGHLLITPVRDASGRWTSGRVETKEDFQAPVGGKLKVDARIKLPAVSGNAARGYWPAFWMLGSPFRGNYWNWPGVGEIDIMENVNGMNSTWAAFHCGTAPGGACNEYSGLNAKHECAPASCLDGFHNFTVEWDRSGKEDELRWYLDGAQLFSVKSSQVDAETWRKATDHSYFLILNVAIGGGGTSAFGGGPDGSTKSGVPMTVDYVSVWKSGA
jgi:beta-glucanase (GH16 family)